MRALVKVCWLLVAVATSATAQQSMWASLERVDRRSCPSESCGVVGQFFRGESVEVLEQKGKWIRTTKYYYAPCHTGRNDFVKKGNDSCSPSNGVISGKFAEWVSVQDLSTSEPPDERADATPDEQLVKESTDFGKHRKIFASAAKALVESGRCTPQNITESSGWNPSGQRKGHYFVTCGEGSNLHLIYLNTKTGQISH